MEGVPSIAWLPGVGTGSAALGTKLAIIRDMFDASGPMADRIEMEFEWDDAKNNACFVRRGIDFAYAVRAFLDPRRIGDGTMARSVTGCLA